MIGTALDVSLIVGIFRSLALGVVIAGVCAVVSLGVMQGKSKSERKALSNLVFIGVLLAWLFVCSPGRGRG